VSLQYCIVKSWRSLQIETDFWFRRYRRVFICPRGKQGNQRSDFLVRCQQIPFGVRYVVEQSVSFAWLETS
jgi:hypothetical protein